MFFSEDQLSVRENCREKSSEERRNSAAKLL